MRHAVITGGSRGIGLAVAAELDAHGWGVFLVSQHPESLAVASVQMKNLAGTLAVDLGHGEAVRATSTPQSPECSTRSTFWFSMRGFSSKNH